MILNLIMNAIETMTGSDRRELTIVSKADNSQNVLVSVADSGPGLTPECVSRVFDALYTTKAGGMGMGLAISRLIVEGYGGRLWAEAKTTHGGAAFQFTIRGAESVAA